VSTTCAPASDSHWKVISSRGWRNSSARGCDMANEPEIELRLRLIPAEGPADPQVIDDLIRLIQQGVVTAPTQAPQITGDANLREPTDDEKRDLSNIVVQVKHRIEQASKDSQEAVAKRNELAKQPDGEAKLREEALLAAEQVVAAVQRAILQ